MKHRYSLAALAITVLASACATSPGKSVSYADIQVADPWIRATPTGSVSSAAYMRLVNTGSEPDRLVSASGDAAESIELHTHLEKDGMLHMEKIDVIDIPAQGDAVLEPRGLHVMLIGLNDELAEGEMVPLELSFENAGTVSIDVPVKRDGAQTGTMNHDAMGDEAMSEDGTVDQDAMPQGEEMMDEGELN